MKTKIRKPKRTFALLFSWESPERAWSARSRQWYILYSLFFVLLITVTVLLAEYLLTLAIIAFIFLWFTHASIPPELVEHQVTSLGIKTFDKLYKWEQIKHYWFSLKEGVNFLNLEVIEKLEKPDFVRTMSLIIKPENEEELFFVLIEHIDYGDRDEIGYNFLTRMLHGSHIDISKYLPDEIYTQEEYLDEDDSEEEPETQKKEVKSKKN